MYSYMIGFGNSECALMDALVKCTIGGNFWTFGEIKEDSKGSKNDKELVSYILLG